MKTPTPILADCPDCGKLIATRLKPHVCSGVWWERPSCVPCKGTGRVRWRGHLVAHAACYGSGKVRS